MSFAVTAGIGAAIGIAGSVGKIIEGIDQKNKANSIHPVWEQYKKSPYADQQLATEQQAYNGRMAGATDEERNIAASQSNFANSAQRNATSSSQALAMAAAGQGQADASYNNLQTKELQNKYNLLSHLENAYATEIREGDKEYNSMDEKYKMDVGQKQALDSAGTTNLFGGISGIGTGLLGVAYSGKKGVFSKKSSGTNTTQNNNAMNTLPVSMGGTNPNIFQDANGNYYEVLPSGKLRML